MRRPFAEVTPSRAGMLQAKAASRKQPRRGVCSFDAAWHQGHALGHVQQVADVVVSRQGRRRQSINRVSCARTVARCGGMIPCGGCCGEG